MQRNLSRIPVFLAALILVVFLACGTAFASVFFRSSQMFSDRDYLPEPDLSGAETISVTSRKDVRITSAGVYVLTGSAEEMAVYVDAGADDEVQLVLDRLNITNTCFPCICVLSAGKVYMTLAGDSMLSVTDGFLKPGVAEAVIQSRQDLTLNGLASLTVSSPGIGITCGENLIITGGTLAIHAASRCIEAEQSIRISGGEALLSAGSDGLYADHQADDTQGFVLITGGTLSIQAQDAGIHALSVLQIDGGTIHIRARSGLESTAVVINGGTVELSASGSGIRAGTESGAYPSSVTLTGAHVSIIMGQGDVDGLFCAGDILVSGGTASIIGSHPVSCGGTAKMTGGTLIINGSEVTDIPDHFTNTPDGWGGWRWNP